jgi:shikimate kinase
VFYLRAGPATIIHRLGDQVAERPLLADPKLNLVETVCNLIAKRDPFYRKAHVVIETDHLTPTQVCEEILRSRQLFD